MKIMDLMNAWRVYDSWRSAKRGTTDGKEMIPAWETADQPPNILSIAHAALCDKWLLARKWADSKKKYTTSCRPLRVQLAYKQRTAQKAREAHETARAAYKDKHKQEPPRNDWRFVWHGILGVLFAFGELPLTLAAMRAMGESEVVTFIMALALSVAIITAGEASGKFAKERNVPALVILVAVSLVGMAALAYFRAAHSDAVGIATAALPPLFLALNVLMFTVTAMCTYRVHDPLLAEVFARSTAADFCERLATETEERLVKLSAEAESAYGIFQADIDWTDAEANRLIDEYRAQNLLIRTDRTPERSYPASFSTYPKTETPNILSGTSWDEPVHQQTAQEEDHETKQATVRRISRNLRRRSPQSDRRLRPAFVHTLQRFERNGHRH